MRPAITDLGVTPLAATDVHASFSASGVTHRQSVTGTDRGKATPVVRTSDATSRERTVRPSRVTPFPGLVGVVHAHDLWTASWVLARLRP